MAGVEWARASRFNWVYDAMGGTPLMEAVLGNWSGGVGVVGADNTLILAAPQPGAGAVYYLRGVWRVETVFPWNGFWAEPEEGDRLNYLEGGSWQNQPGRTVISLGRPLTAGTVVQLYYLYLTGERTGKYEALNNYPCLRRAWRSRYDYTFDYAVDRIFDLMAVAAFGVQEGVLTLALDKGLQFLWQEYYRHAASAVPPLVWDDFERSLYDRGAYLIYYGSSRGPQGFGGLGVELPPGATSRALKVALATDRGAAGSTYWVGYGFNWRLDQPPFSELDQVTFSWQGQASCSRVADYRYLSAGGAARLRIREEYREQEPGFVRLAVTKGGSLGEAEYTFEFYRFGAEEPEKRLEGLKTSSAPVQVLAGVELWWEAGAVFALGDEWTFSVGAATSRPRRLQVVLNNASPGASDPWGAAHTYVVALPDRWATFQTFALPFSRFIRLDNVVFDGDRRRGSWHPWAAAGANLRPGQMQVTDHEEELLFEGEVFYTQACLAWELPETTTALGFWTGINPEQVNSTGQVEINFLVKPEVVSRGPVRLTVKLKDSQGQYFTNAAVEVPVGVWSRVSLEFGSFLPEEPGQTLSHPVVVVDLGLAGPETPLTGRLYLAEVKFGPYRRFPGDRLRLLEFKYEELELVLPPFTFWLDRVGLNLEAYDPYPYCPRLAISLGPTGRNPWRGPTLVHYAHPLAPYLVGRQDLKTNFLALHQQAQEEFQRRYGGLKGPLLPVHTRNDLENIALCGEENFNRFCWWPKYRHYGRRVAAWHFNGGRVDAEGRYPLSFAGSGETYTTGICQPGATAWANDGSNRYPYYDPGTDFLVQDRDFTVEIVAKFTVVGSGTDCLASIWQGGTPGQRSWVVYRSGNSLVFAYSWDGVNCQTVAGGGITTADSYYHLVVSRRQGMLRLFVNGELKQEQPLAVALFNAAAPLAIGKSMTGWPSNLKGAIDFLAIYLDYGLEAAEVAGRWRVIQGLENGSAYPEVGHALGQYWAFYRLAEYYFVSHDRAAWEVLDPWLTWFTTYLAPEGNGWRLPVWFSEYGFSYGTYDPGAMAAVVIGCLYIFMRNGDDRALETAQKILTDLRENRASGDYGGYLYKSDYHYAWLNALVAHAFGLAVTGRCGAAYRYPASPEEEDHFARMIQNFLALSGDGKPNLLNKDLIPFSYVEDVDVWDYAPHYVFMRQMGSLEAVVLMLQAALDWARFSGSREWFRRLWSFLVREDCVSLGEGQIKSLSASRDYSLIKNWLRVFYGSYPRGPQSYAEVQDEESVARWGPQPLELNLAWGQPVITEDPTTAATLAKLWLQRLGRPQETVELETWLEGGPVQVLDPVEVSVGEAGWAGERFLCYRKELDLDQGRVRLRLGRDLQLRQAWAVELPGDLGAAWAIEAADPGAPDWPVRTFAY